MSSLSCKKKCATCKFIITIVSNLSTIKTSSSEEWWRGGRAGKCGAFPLLLQIVLIDTVTQVKCHGVWRARHGHKQCNRNTNTLSIT